MRQAASNLRVLTDTTVSGLFADNWLSALHGNRLYKIRVEPSRCWRPARYDQPLVFANNDLPGIMFAAAAQRLMRLYGVRPGTAAVVATANATATRRRSTASTPALRSRPVVDLHAGSARRGRGRRSALAASGS